MTSDDGQDRVIDTAAAEPVQTDDNAVAASLPTALPARDPDGNLLDEWGLPVAAPLRAQALAKLRRTDPATLPTDEWGLPTGAAGRPWRTMKLERLGRADPLNDPKDW